MEDMKYVRYMELSDKQKETFISLFSEDILAGADEEFPYNDDKSDWDALEKEWKKDLDALFKDKNPLFEILDENYAASMESGNIGYEFEKDKLGECTKVKVFLTMK